MLHMGNGKRRIILGIVFSVFVTVWMTGCEQRSEKPKNILSESVKKHMEEMMQAYLGKKNAYGDTLKKFSINGNGIYYIYESQRAFTGDSKAFEKGILEDVCKVKDIRVLLERGMVYHYVFKSRTAPSKERTFTVTYNACKERSK